MTAVLAYPVTPLGGTEDAARASLKERSLGILGRLGGAPTAPQDSLWMQLLLQEEEGIPLVGASDTETVSWDFRCSRGLNPNWVPVAHRAFLP